MQSVAQYREIFIFVSLVSRAVKRRSSGGSACKGAVEVLRGTVRWVQWAVRGTVGAGQTVRWVLYGGTAGGARKVEGVRWVGYAFSPVASMNFYWEAGARVTMHTRLANLNVPAVQRVDDRTIEVIATGLPLRHGIFLVSCLDLCFYLNPALRWCLACRLKTSHLS